MDVAFIENAQHDVDRDQRGQNQVRLVLQRILKSFRRALERAADRGGYTDPVHGGLDRGDGGTERAAWRQIERNGVCDEETLMVHRERRSALLEMRDRRQRNHGLGAGRDRRTGGGYALTGGTDRI